MAPMPRVESRPGDHALARLRWALLALLAGLNAACHGPNASTAITPRIPEPTSLANVVAPPVTRAPVDGSPAWVYARGDYQGRGEVVVTTGAGAQRQVVAPVGFFNSVLDRADVHRETGAILFADHSGGGLVLSQPGTAPAEVQCAGGGPGPTDSLELRISPGGHTVAYARHGSQPEVRLIGMDGCDDRLLVGDHGRYVDHPLFLVPLGWSADSRRVILVPWAEVDAESRGLFEADVDSGEVTLVAGTDVGLADVALSPDGTRAAFTTLERPVDEHGDLMPIPPNRLEVVDLATGTVTVIAQEAADTFYGDPFWSPDGSRLGYTVGPYSQPRAWTVQAADLAAGTTSTLATDDPASRPGLVPHLWLPGDRVVYMADAPGPGSDAVLWLQDLATGTWTEVDRAPAIAVLGWYE